MPEEERLRLLSEDNARMDSAMMSRHLARFLHASSPGDLGDAGRQISLLTDENFVSNHGSILKGRGGDGDSEGVRRLYDEVTVLALRIFSSGEGEKQKIFDTIRGKITEAAGLPPDPTEEGK
jgi:hypothetical protein